MPPVLDQALCIRQWDWSETSQTVSLFCRTLGVVRGLAKGSKRPRAVYSGGIEMLTLGSTGIILRPSSELALVTHWDLEQTFPALRRELAAHYAGLYVAELIHHAIHDHDPHTNLFDVAVKTLTEIGDNRSPRVLLEFQWSVLVETGYRPDVSVDAATGEPLVHGQATAFAPALGGFTQAAHAELGPDRSNQGSVTWRVRPGTLALLQALSGTGALDLTADAESIERANRLLASYLRHVLGREPSTLAMVFPGPLPR